MYVGLNVNCLVLPSDFNQNQNMLINLDPKYWISLQTVWCKSYCSTQTNGFDDTNSHSLQLLCNSLLLQCSWE